MNIDYIKSTLQESIQVFRDINPEKHSYAYIGMKSNNSTSFVERAAKNRLGVPLDPKKVLPLANLVCDKPRTREVAKFFADHLIDQSDILKDAIYAKFVQENDSLISDSLEEELSYGDNYIAYSLCCTENGVTEDEIIEAAGGSVLEATKHLTKKGYITLNQNRYFAIKKNFSLKSFSNLKSVLPTLTNHYKPSNVGKERNYIHTVTSGLNREGVKKLQEAHRKHHEEVRNIMKEYEGDISVFSIGIADTFTSRDIDSKVNLKTTFKSLFISTLIALSLFSSSSTTTLANSLSLYQIQSIIFSDNSNSNIDSIQLNNGYEVTGFEISEVENDRIQNAIKLIRSNQVDFVKGGDTGGGRTTDPSLPTGLIENPYKEIELEEFIDKNGQLIIDVYSGPGATGGGGRTVDQ